MKKGGSVKKGGGNYTNVLLCLISQFEIFVFFMVERALLFMAAAWAAGDCLPAYEGIRATGKMKAARCMWRDMPATRPALLR